jgi:site-specific DNA-cytosine methylase
MVLPATMRTALLAAVKEENENDHPSNFLSQESTGADEQGKSDILAIAFTPGHLIRGYGIKPSAGIFPTLVANKLVTMGDQAPCVALLEGPNTSAVRQLTPLEWERLQGFPDHWTLEAVSEKTGKVCEQADETRYHQLGNAVAVPVVRWIAERIRQVDEIFQKKEI